MKGFDGIGIRGKTHIRVSDIRWATQSNNNRLADSLGLVIVAQHAAVVNPNGRDARVVDKGIRLCSAAAVAGGHDLCPIDVEGATGPVGGPGNGLTHLVDGRRAAAAGHALRHDQEAVRRDLGQEVARRRAVARTGAVAPDEDGHGARGGGIVGAVDGVAGQAGVGLEALFCCWTCFLEDVQWREGRNRNGLGWVVTYSWAKGPISDLETLLEDCYYCIRVFYSDFELTDWRASRILDGEAPAKAARPRITDVSLIVQRR